MFKQYSNIKKQFLAGPKSLSWQLHNKPNSQNSLIVLLTIWLYSCIHNHLTFSSRILLSITGIITIYSLISLEMPIYLMTISILTPFIINIIIGYIFRPHTKSQRNLPLRIAVGSKERIEYTIRNTGKLTIFNLAIDTTPFPYGLKHCKHQRPHITNLEPEQKINISSYLIAKHRGYFTLPALRVDTAFPLNLWKWGCKGTGLKTLIVYPKFTPLSKFDLSSGLRYQPGGIALTSKVGNSMEFLGCREYHEGDDLRQIHWSSWARTSYPVIKEYREEYLCRSTLIIDTYQAKKNLLPIPYHLKQDPTFEAAISLSAAVADYLCNKDYIIDLFAAGPNIYKFRSGRSLAYLNNILDILSCLEPTKEQTFTTFSEEVYQEISHISSAVLILLHWDKSREDLIKQLTINGVSVKTIFITNSKTDTSKIPPQIITIDEKDIHTGKCKIL